MAYADIRDKRRYQREWLAGRRKEWFQDKNCVDCGCDEDLELHHIDPAKKVSHRIWSWSLERRLEELAKCIVLCHYCHKERHREN